MASVNALMVSLFLYVIPASGNLFEVRSGSEGFTNDEEKKTCSCWMWQLSGIPYVHATKSMYSFVVPPKPKKMCGRSRKKRIRSKGTMRDGYEQSGNSGAQQGSAGRSKKGGTGGSKQGSVVAGGLKGCVVAVGSKKGGAGGYGCKRKDVSSAGTRKTRLDSSGADTRTNSGPSADTRTTRTSNIEETRCKNPPKEVGKTRRW
nr:hypothetical protein [Tanacetum cinerariifolium]